ncbi:MAG: BLUF domain-containing protein [Rhodobacteraceae bacterium]|nr:MAG: BLUF domain-containing protein [Paracoccaceae bacterium]
METSLSYASRSLIRPEGRDMAALIETCRRNNARLGVTGALYFDGRQFFQVIEGDEAVVACLFDAIRRDPRHTDVQIVARGPISRRAFAGWSMKFVDGAAHPQVRPRFVYEEATKKAPPHVQENRLADLRAA